MKMTSAEIRECFLDYFIQHNHLMISSSSLVPADDPTLLVVNSGMAPLKPYFTGEKQPPHPRLCNIQKCIRTNDIESVGDRHHLTLFEMMGNWSIGDYFKEEAIMLAWSMIRDIFRFDALRIYVTVYGGDKKFPNIPPDNESREIWSQLVPSERIIFLDAEANFWGPAGETGPCGPCTEVFIDRGEEYGCRKSSCGPNCVCGRFLEIWNAGVFMQYYLHKDKTLTELPLKSVDAGAGLDRFAVILQGADSIYETDLLSPIVEVFTSVGGLRGDSRSVRIMTDHIRCGVFMIADDIYPGNTRREYVLRRILRRALLHANLTGTKQETLILASNLVIDHFAQYYPELETNRKRVGVVIAQEASTFEKVLRRGLREFGKIATKTSKVISGDDAFKLYDTLGFPLELTKELAQAQDLSVDEERFGILLEEQRRRSRAKRLVT